uniref:RNA polymerase II-associated protein 1 N-terminal domain-containing protein n=1 Tax=Glossina pallidipes TaxID=7398 RepID=A0A1A9ZVS9_GLOPL
MMKRPKRGETEKDILRMQQEFLAEKAKNPKIKPAAQIVKISKPSKTSLFAKSRRKNGEENATPAAHRQVPSDNASQREIILDQIHTNIKGEVNTKQHADVVADTIIGDIVEKLVKQPKHYSFLGCQEGHAFPVVEKMKLTTPKAFSNGKSIFAQIMEQNVKTDINESHETIDTEDYNLRRTKDELGVRFEDVETGEEAFEENLKILREMTEEEILKEKQTLMESLDPSIIALLNKKHKERLHHFKEPKNKNAVMNSMGNSDSLEAMMVDLHSSNAAVPLIRRGAAEEWIHFDVVEKDKLEWMSVVRNQKQKLKPGEKFEARFDWKGVLLPFSPDEADDKEERELYLHGDEPQRPGYTLQELFRLARSHIIQQRMSAFSAIAGMLSIYQQGFYDETLDLPITKIFFLLRFGFDDNNPAILEVVAKALAFLFYNETDEFLLDFCYENPGCHWQPTLQVLKTDSDLEDSFPVENLQKQLAQLQISTSSSQTFMRADVEENEEESKSFMTDFQLCDADLIEGLVRTNALYRIRYILNTIKPHNSCVISCFKMLIRLARSGEDIAMKIANDVELMKCLFQNFLPKLEVVDIAEKQALFLYGYPQHLCLKLLRIMISTKLIIANKVCDSKLIDVLENYLSCRDDLQNKLIKIQIECLRILKCLLLLRMGRDSSDNFCFRRFLPAFRYMLEWHFNHLIYEEGGPYLIRQHAAAIFMCIASTTGPVGREAITLLTDVLHDCSCKWFHTATRVGMMEFSQTTLLNACLDVVIWYKRNFDPTRFHNFVNKYVKAFIESESFQKFAENIVYSSLILHDSVDRRNVYQPLPNAGSIALHPCGPQLIISQKYPTYFLSSLWRLMELYLECNNKIIFESLLRPAILEPLVKFLHSISVRCNRYLATNFFTKMELKFIHQLLCFKGLETYFQTSEMLQIVYNFLSCLTAEYVSEIEQLFEKVIFNPHYINASKEVLDQWRHTCLELVYPHYIVVQPNELSLALPFSQLPILPPDWPYFQLRLILQRFLENVQQKSSTVFSERQVLQMTLSFVTQLEECNRELHIVAPTEKLMYLMIAFMGQDSNFLDRDIHEMLQQHLLKFYAESKNIKFDFDAVYPGKCKFENLYALFIDHFQAVSYGDQLFSSLVMVPLAQKYDHKWRRRVWSDYASALRFLNCEESLLIGGLSAYLEPAEEEESLLKAYNQALNTNLLSLNSLPYKIAKHHVEQFKQRNVPIAK